MARPGIEFKAVERVARQLLSQGQHPSVQRVRDVLGTGSNTTIAKHLKIWQKAFSQSQSPTLPEAVPDDLMVPLDDFWNTAVARAESNYQKLKDELEARVAASESNEAKAISKFEKKSEEFDVLQQILSESKKSLRETQQQFNILQGNHTALSTELIHAHTEMETAFNLLKEQNQNFDNERNTTNNMHEKSLKYERERTTESENRLLNEIDQLRQTIKVMKDKELSEQKKLQYLNENNHQLELIVSQKLSDLKNKNKQLEITRQKYLQDFDEWKQHNAITQQQLTKSLETIDALRQSNEHSKNNEIALMENIEQLKKSIIHLKQTIKIKKNKHN